MAGAETYFAFDGRGRFGRLRRMETNPWKIGLQAARDNLIPGLVLWGAAFALLGFYLWMPSGRQVFETLAAWQTRYGLPFYLSCYLFFCAVIPYVFCLAIPALRPRQPLKALLFAFGFWTVMGLILPRFYALQSHLYGDGRDLATLLKKIATDQLGYTAFFASPAVALSHLWKDRGYRWSAIAPLLGRGWYRRLVVPNLVMNWTIWFPALCVVYSLPHLLQAHVAGLIGGFWALMSLQIAAHTKVAVDRSAAR